MLPNPSANKRIAFMLRFVGLPVFAYAFSNHARKGALRGT